MTSAALLLLPLAGEGGPVKRDRLRDIAAWARPGDVALVPRSLHPALRATLSRKREKDMLWGLPMILHRSPTQLGRARAMRRAPTKAKEIVWRSLRANGLGLKFRRQVPIGPYIADFTCLPAKLVVELDGPPHDKLAQRERDRRRDVCFVEHGWRVLRVPSEIVFGGGDLVLDRIRALLPDVLSSDPTSSGHLLPQEGEGEREADR